MTPLPYSRTIQVNLTRRDRFPSRRGFGIPLFLTSVDKAGLLDATYRTRTYSDASEALDDGYTTSDDLYQALLAAFSQNPRPLQIKAGFYDDAIAVDATTMQAQMALIRDYDNNWFWLAHESALRDTVMQDGLSSWCEANPVFGMFDSNDVLTESAADTTCIAARNKNQFERSCVFYDRDATQFPALAYAAGLGTRNYDNPNSNYTGKYKKLNGFDPIYPNTAAINAITGFTPGTGQSSTVGHLANCLIDIGQKQFVVEGSTSTQNVFIDTIHFSNWIVARTEEAILALLLNNDAVPMTDEGMEMIGGVVRAQMQAATRSGCIAIDENPLTGVYEPAVEIIVPKIIGTTTAAQRAARIAPPVTCRFRYAGAAHYVPVEYFMEF